MTEVERAKWMHRLIAALGIAALAAVCLVSRADDFDHEQMAVSKSITWEIRSGS